MSDSTPPTSKPGEQNVQSMLDTVIGAGKSAVHKLKIEDIQRFIENQPGVGGQVTISNVRGAGEVGASSGIVLFTAAYRDGSATVSRELVLRHAPGSEARLWFEYDLARQFKVQRAVYGSGCPVPEPLWLDARGTSLGVPGYVMSLTRGVAPHPDAFTRGPIAQASTDDRERMLDQVMRALVAIHQTDIKTKGLEDFAMPAAGSTPMERCVNWYWNTWEWIHLANFERLVPVHRWLLDHAPKGEPELVHGDATLHNYLFDEARLVGVVDWEMSCLARAEADLALQCLTNEIFAAPAGSGHLRPPTDAEWLARYRKAGGRALQDFDYYKKFAAYMIIVAVSALQRNVPVAARAAQDALLRPCWQRVES